MKREEDKDLVEFFKITNRVIRKHGIKKLLTHIRRIEMEDEQDYFTNITEFILVQVVKEFNIKRERLFDMKERGAVTQARKTAIILMKIHLNISDSKIGHYFQRVRQVVWNTWNEYKQMQEGDWLDEKFLTPLRKINEKVEDHKKKLPVSNNHIQQMENIDNE